MNQPTPKVKSEVRNYYPPMNHTQTQLKQAYQIVSEDLFNALLQAPAGETVKFSNLGRFKKSEHLVQSKKYGQHVYYKLSFHCFGKLKEAFHNQLKKKYKIK
jgi:hypothetical protein